MSSNYYSMRDAKVRIAHELMNRGWEVQGYHADQSDSMTDYYCPASWDGIATKNGYILVVDHTTAAEAREIKKYNPKGNLSFEDRERISKLEAMTIERGATAGEEANAKALIEKIQQKVSSEPAYEVIGMSLAHMANPGKCKWHIEKDGKLYDKGTGLTKYADMPDEWVYDINKMEFKDGYKYWRGYGDEPSTERTITDEERKIINDFKALILRFERVAMGLNSCGDGTAETEAKATEQQQKEGYEKVVKQVKKTVLKMVEVIDRKNIKVGDYLSIKHHSGFWLVTDSGERTGTWKINGVATKQTKNTFNYESVGAASRGYKQVKNAIRYYNWEDSMLKDIEAGTTKIFELKEVEEVQEVETWEKIDKTQKTNNSRPEKKQEEKQEQTAQTTTEQKTSIINHDITITADVDTRDNSPLWVVKVIDKLNNDEYKKVAEQFKTLKGYYSKFKHGFIFKYDPTSVLKGDNSEPNIEQEKPSKPKETVNSITDWSTSLICELGLTHQTYLNNQEYKSKLIEKLNKYNINITDELINNVEYDGLKTVLKTIKSDIEHQKQIEQQQAEKTQLIEKIDKNIESLQSKIDSLSGDYKVNTYKRMQEQASRDSKIESYTIDIKMLEYVKQKLIDNEPITALEKGLTVKAFTDMIHQYYCAKYGRYPREIKFPTIDYTIPLDGWYNKEVPQKQKRLQKQGITDSVQLNKAVDEYKLIYDECRKIENPIKKQIKNLENKYKIQQKGDINFTPVKVVERMIEYAQIDNNSIVLEPSAGIGNIADQIKTITEHVECIEYNSSFSELLRLKNHKVIGDDILQYNRFNYYDAVIMNPPFSEEIDHIKHAYKTLKAGGKLISITSPSWTFNNNRKAQEFREWFENVGGIILEELESGTFEMTGVRTLMIEINKEEETRQEAI